MPRMARQKSFDAIFHVMAKSISEVDLFKDGNDKKKYMELIKYYQEIYCFRVYGYCLMDNHVHLIIDANGADISKIMHDINFSYAQYFNGRHKRHGHLFQDRFRSKIVKSEKYLFALSAYIHNNPTDIQGYETYPERYLFSSLSIYLGIRRDPFEIVDEGFILSLFGNNIKNARRTYQRFVMLCDGRKFKDEIEFVDEKTEYKSERKILVRNFKTDDVVDFIVSKMEITKIQLHMKNCKNVIAAKAMLVFLMRSLSNCKCSQICSLLGNITQVRVSKLSSTAIELINKEEKYRNIVNEFLECCAG